MNFPSITYSCTQDEIGMTTRTRECLLLFSAIQIRILYFPILCNSQHYFKINKTIIELQPGLWS